MGTIGNCCCDCCMTDAEMPWTKFILTNQLANCTTGGGYTPPEATFQRTGCCFQATMPVTCDWEYLCQEYANQTANLSVTVEYYQQKVPYISPGGTPDCPCIPIQRKSGTRTSVHRSIFYHKRRLVEIQVTVGKMLYTCDAGDPACKFFIAVNYFYETREYLGSLCPGFGFDEVSRSCVGLYRDGTCSVTNSWTESSGYVNCNSTLPGPLDVEEITTKGIACVSRIKYYTTLPTTYVTISNSDNNFSCGTINCGVCAGTDCFPALPPYSGPESNFFYSDVLGAFGLSCYCDPGCAPYEGMFYDPDEWIMCWDPTVCPDLIEGASSQFSVPIFTCSTVFGSTCCVANGDRCYVTGSDPDYFEACSYLQNIITGEIIQSKADARYIIQDIDFCYGGAAPPPVVAGCPKPAGTSDCDGTGKCKDCSGTPCVYVICDDVEGDLCKEEITAYSCSIGEIQRFTAGNFCITTPTTTLGFA